MLPVMLPLAELQPDPANPRVNSGAVEMVAASIREFGFNVPIVVNGERKILAGHTRLRAAKLLGLDEVPCVVVDSLTPEQERAFSVVDNRTSELAFWDADKLAEVVGSILEEHVSMFDLDALLDGAPVPESATREKEEPEKRAGLDMAPFEKYQYLVVVCRTTFDYQTLIERFGVVDVQQAYVGGRMKRGSSTGRVMEFADFWERLSDGS